MFALNIAQNRLAAEDPLRILLTYSAPAGPTAELGGNGWRAGKSGEGRGKKGRGKKRRGKEEREKETLTEFERHRNLTTRPS